ncbi:MAG: alanine racemase [Alphaproteobacteria bacterium]
MLDIDLDAVAANWRRLAALTAPAECAAVVKADAYGLGAGPVVRALAAAGCRSFYVALPDEGRAVRAAVGTGPAIGVLAGYLSDARQIYQTSDLTPVLNTPLQIDGWAAGGGGRAAFVHVDSGINRLGLGPEQWQALVTGGDLGFPLAGVLSHLACADEPDHPLNRAQLAAFRGALARLPAGTRASFANSSGIFLGGDFHFGQVRPGAALYGVNPTPGRPNPMRPAVRLRGRILQVRHIDRGQAVGYGATYIAPSARKVATVAVGYADGLHRAASNRGSVLCQSHEAPIIGRVSMDMITIDVSDIPDHAARPDLWVDVIGPHRDVDAVAADCGTIGYEVLTALGRRYRRRYRGGTHDGAAGG